MLLVNSMYENSIHRPDDVSKNEDHYIYFIDDGQKMMAILKRELREMSANPSTDEETAQDLATDSCSACLIA
jgi:hypothetical protein